MAQIVYALLAGGAVWESFLAIWQFWRQLGIDTSGVAKVLMGGGRLMRAYGTFPHSNVLAAFLVIGLISLFYFYLKSHNKYLNFLIPTSIFFVVLGLLLTFSRAAWLASGLFFLYFSRRRPLLFIIPLVVLAFFYWLIIPRLQVSLNEPALALRRVYNQIGWEIIKTHPLTGVGFGKQAEYAIQNHLYQKYGLIQEWQWQPTHNLYLLMAADTGFIGLGLFLFFVIFLFIKGQRSMVNGPETAMLLSLLFLGLFDHFLWTLPSGRMMLILVLGLNLLSLASRPRSSTG